MDSLGCLVMIGFLTVVIVGLLWVMGQAREQEARARQTAYDTYQAALGRLKADPTNADLKQQTLQLGRDYANRTRDQKGVTVYDEMAVMNDINAATAGASAQAPAAVATAPTASVEDRLKRLDELRAKGIISDQEYIERRQKILNEL